MNNTSAKHFDYLFKIVLIGDSAVGKTNLLSQLIHNKFIQDSKATIGVEFGTMTFNINNKIIKAQIWDTAGQERYKAITHAYYRGSYGAIIVYDVTQPKTLNEAVNNWLLQLNNYTENIPILLIGNKTDMKEKRQVTESKGREEATRNNLMYFETSAKTGENVQRAFYELIKEIYNKQVEKEKKMKRKKPMGEFKGREVVKLSSKKKSGCC